VRTYASVDEFLNRPSDDHQACVIVDLCMPGKTGLDLLGAVDAANGRVLCMITGHGDQPMVVQAMNAGASHVLLKPFEDSSLLGAIQRALTR
jgi:two-component system, LuxR family, response regulator FixJ